MRRGHGSTRIQGVRLRPPPKVAASRTQIDGDDQESASSISLNESGPLTGVVVCATGVFNKSQLFNQAMQLGASSSTHFTNLTTHLVAEDAGSAKYLCALQRGIPIMSSEWIRTSHATWLSGGNVELEDSVQRHRLPIFKGVKLCLTGFDDIQERMRLHSLVAKNGGVYSKGFESSVTHLLVCGTSGDSVKTQTALKLNRTRGSEPRIHVVWEEWLWDCLEYGGMWDPADYSFEKPRPVRKPLKSTVVSDNPLKTTPAPLPPSIKNDLLIRAEDPAEKAYARHAPGIFSQIWNGIAKAYLDADGKPRGILQNVTIGVEAGPGALISRVSNAKALALHEPSSSLVPRQPFARATSITMPVTSSHLAPSRAPSLMSLHQPSGSTEQARPVFSGYRFFALGTASCDALATAVRSHGGIWLSASDDADFILVRLTESALFWELHDTEDFRGRTECWVEKCVYDERLVLVDEHLTFTPLRNPAPITGAAQLTICFSGLSSAEGCWLKRVVRAIGANHSPTFTRKCTHLICDTGDGLKSERAREWGVPVVPSQWLFDLATGAELITRRDGHPSGLNSLDVTDDAMADITNASGAFSSLVFESSNTDNQHTEEQLAPSSSSFGKPSLLIKMSLSEPLITPSCSPSPLKSLSLSNINEGEVGSLPLQDSMTGKRRRSDDSVNTSLKKARPGSRSKIALERSSSVISPRTICCPIKDNVDEPTTALGVEEDSVRVMYQDPASEAQRRKLFQMFSAPEQPDVEEQTATKRTGKGRSNAADVSGKSGRRRVAGF